MDSDSEEVLSQSQSIINRYIQEKGQTKGVREYLDNVKYPPVQDFAEGLEWFNVSEPLFLKKHLKGKIVVLDFFTYCCINCMHIIPDLREIEEVFSVEDGLVVIGVHSAKFENEKISKNILAAVQRYNIGHPVVNDHNSLMWKNCDVHCWPTLLMLGPNGNPLVMCMGEGNKDDLLIYIREALDYYKEKKQISNHKLPFRSAYHLLPDLKGPLLFPGKITNFVDENNDEVIAISDTGNNRILIIKGDGTILKQIGGKKLGFKDGSLEDAEFNNPQGLVFLNKTILFVADTENHAIRKVDLNNNKVETIAGNGAQGHDRSGGNLWTKQIISSPWDLCLYTTPATDNLPEYHVLIIAMAGTHQIWALFLQDTIWWKNKKYQAGTCVAIVGSGAEQNKNNQYPHAAAFAQPSGLAISSGAKEVFVADSESSSIRKISLVDGKVSPVVGGDRNPYNLFAFGDKDGVLFDAKLQHSLGVAMSRNEKSIFVADTYNHKIKKIDIEKNHVTTISVPLNDTTDGQLHMFNEPAGLCVSVDGSKVYLADTNNHQIKILKLDDNENITGIDKLDLKISEESSVLDKSKYKIIQIKPLSVNTKGGKIILSIKLNFKDGLGLTQDAPQKWIVDVPNATWSCVPNSGCDLKNVDMVVSVPEMNSAKGKTIDIAFNLITCTSETCLPKNFIVRANVEYNNNGKTNINEEVMIHLNPLDIVAN
ncbi:NHL repeat-containing protein 2 isoform X2 [Aethina tumida]|nr:NHL repeat-containing protein 2 isoform X2 [Aethina tumida]XP_019868172.1 NHL repeat-containing protein 2 isoform X2 [Aethina tumida]